MRAQRRGPAGGAAAHHQCDTNQRGGCARAATSSTSAHLRATVAGRITYLSASYSRTISGVSVRVSLAGTCGG